MINEYMYEYEEDDRCYQNYISFSIIITEQMFCVTSRVTFASLQ